MEDKDGSIKSKHGLISRFLQWLIQRYQTDISPYIGAHCKYTPTCSQYALEAIRIHGVLRGIVYAFWRILRCNPFSKGGYDPVPPKKLNEN